MEKPVRDISPTLEAVDPDNRNDARAGGACASNRRHAHDAALAGSPSRHFDVTVNGFFARDAADDPRTEDAALTDYLMRAWLELASLSPTPVPRCPRCDGLRTHYRRPARTTRLPTYFCEACRQTFNRLTGTPFARLRHQSKAVGVIPMLARQMALTQVGEQTGLTYAAILSWLQAFRCYLVELDPSGSWEARVRLGMHALPQATCKRCGFEGGFPSGGFDAHRRRRIRCPRCGRHRLLDVSQREGQALDAVVVRDSSENAVRRKRRYHPDAPMPPVNCAARVDESTREVAARTLPKLEDIAVSARTSSSRRTHRREDVVLSAFLRRHVDAALGVKRTPCRCPWCGSGHTDYLPHPRPGGLPGLRCEACFAWFTRVSNTPLVHPSSRKHARRFLTMLGWRESHDAVARELGVTRQAALRWIHTWRQWLLLLDPTGAMEARVMLGLPPPSRGLAVQQRE
jgi:transposase-like protein